MLHFQMIKHTKVRAVSQTMLYSLYSISESISPKHSGEYPVHHFNPIAPCWVQMVYPNGHEIPKMHWVVWFDSHFPSPLSKEYSVTMATSLHTSLQTSYK